MSLVRPLSGITVPLATPLTDSRTLAIDALERLTACVIDGGVSAIFVLGTTGEGPCLSTRQRQQVVEQVCRTASGRGVPVLVGITDSSAAEAIALAEFSASQGAQAVVYAGPTYSPVSQPELLDHVSRLADSLPLPLFLYNMTSHTKVVFAAETVEVLAGHGNVHGLKDSSASLTYFQAVRRVTAYREDFGLLMGPEELLLPAMLCGATGGVNGGSNLFPGLYAALYRAATAGDFAEAKRLQDIVQEVSASIYGLGSYSSSYLRGLKCALSILGFGSGALAEPYNAFGPGERERIARAIAELRDRMPL